MKQVFRYFNLFEIVFFALVSIGVSAQDQQTVFVLNNYNNWNWDSVYVAKNKFISLAIVPDAAGRILEYNLGEVQSLWINPKLMGKSFRNNDEVKMSDWRNFGGYRLVPLPIDNCSVNTDGSNSKTKRWPPPVVIGDNPYKARIIINKQGKQTIEVESGIQELPVPQFNYQKNSYIYPKSIDEKLQYKRSLHIENNSSLVTIKHTLTNVGVSTVKRGIMISSQHVSRSKPELTDGENFVAYVPFDKKYKLPNGDQYEIMGTADSRWQYVNKNRIPLDKNNPKDVEKYYNNGTNWKGEVAPGIYEVEYDYYLMSGFHIISSKSWICYVDKINNTAFAKILEPYDPNLEYEDGINVSVFCSGLETGYLETEVKTPLYTLKPGAHFDYTEIHGAAKIVHSPVLEVNKTGIISEKLNLNHDNNQISGKYGIFIEGIAVLCITESSGKKVEFIVQKEVNPLKAFELNYNLKEKTSISKLEVFVIDANKKYHLLDSSLLK